MNVSEFPRKAALFDVDRTLIRKDTATLFTRYRRDEGQSGLLDALQMSWWVFQHSLGLLDAPKAAAKALRKYRGTPEATMIQTCEQWYPNYVRPHLTEKGRQRVLAHQRAGDIVALVTGTTRYAAGPLARELGISDVVCSEMEVNELGCFTGNVVEPLSFGLGKLVRAEKWAQVHHVRLDEAVFYTDSITDLPLLERVRVPVVINPDRRLRRIADRRHWSVEFW